jgi:hypothetical protein
MRDRSVGIDQNLHVTFYTGIYAQSSLANCCVGYMRPRTMTLGPGRDVFRAEADLLKSSGDSKSVYGVIRCTTNVENHVE